VQLVAPNSNHQHSCESKSKPTHTYILSVSSFCNYLSQSAMFLTLWLFSFTAFSQSQVIENTNNLITKGGVSISSTLENCNDLKNGTHKEYVLLNVHNENSFPVKLSFKKNLWFDGKCNSCTSTSSEHVVSITIEAESEIHGTCSINDNLRIFSKMLNLEKVRKLTNYELVDITVDEIK
jgi:hypothetical protein